MKKKHLLPLLFLLFPLTAITAQAQNEKEDEIESETLEIPQRYRLRVSFRDKKENPYSVKRPQEFLSPKAIERRKRLGIKVDAYDLPVTPKYLRALEQNGCTIYNVSKWNNTAIVEVGDTACITQLAQLPFVIGVKCVWIGPKEISFGKDADPFTLAALLPDNQEITEGLEALRREELEKDSTNYAYRHKHYGSGFRQAEMLQADQLHEMGFRGEGMTIAVIDGGFHNADLVVPEARILGTRNFVHPGYSVFYEPEDHGTMVLSTIGANQTGRLVGTAPAAQFYLLQSEDGNSEQIVEEDNWCAAVEYADSLGCDVISTSLGYYKFDEGRNNHAYSDLDGQTAANSRAASLAASRGMLVLNSAGNEGDGRRCQGHYRRRCYGRQRRQYVFLLLRLQRRRSRQTRCHGYGRPQCRHLGNQQCALCQWHKLLVPHPGGCGHLPLASLPQQTAHRNHQGRTTVWQLCQPSQRSHGLRHSQLEESLRNPQKIITALV